MKNKKHRQRHIELHNALDELVADYIVQADKLPSESTIMDLMKWSYVQTVKPDHKAAN